ncbi:hypothetical protein LOK49_LG11G01417 [Camellia lanceoleosa]|uniref:Uncharacterized protein n=1 Tax=Camellia lanceoleosa TaxID=1840588 RepID=A0ACC0G401_9ERIC|nr:hypothetical protein LOK49_LG11G01417 [Camellia lanceoleosa]
MDDVLGNLRYALQLQETWQNSNDQFSTVESPEAVPSLDGTAIVELARRGDIDEMSLGSIGDSDFFSSNLARCLTTGLLITFRHVKKFGCPMRTKFQTVILQTCGVIKYLRTVCEHARDVIQNAWSRKILNELYQVFLDALRKIQFLMCTKFNDDNDCQKYLFAKNIVKLMRHSPFGYNRLKFSIGCATDEIIHGLRKGFQ